MKKMDSLLKVVFEILWYLNIILKNFLNIKYCSCIKYVFVF